MTWRFWGGREEEVTVTDSIQQKTTWKHFYSNDTEKNISVFPATVTRPSPQEAKEMEMLQIFYASLLQLSFLAFHYFLPEFLLRPHGI